MKPSSISSAERPTQPGWYWLQTAPHHAWVIDLVRPNWLDERDLFYTHSGRRVATTDIHRFVGPLKPPDSVASSVSAAKSMDVIEESAPAAPTVAEVLVKPDKVQPPAVGSKHPIGGAMYLVTAVLRSGRGWLISYRADAPRAAVKVLTLTQWLREVSR